VATEDLPFYEYPVTERMPLLPRLLALVPGKNPRNLQRLHYLHRLQKKQGRPPPPGVDTEWQLLLMGGHGGIGHVDVFKDDQVALNWYNRKPERDLLSTQLERGMLWRFLREQVLDEPGDMAPQDLQAILGSTPSVGGMIPKLLVSMDTGLEGEHCYASGTPGKTEVLLKVEPPEYPGLLSLEALCLELHEQSNFEIPQWRQFEKDGLRFLAIERFDRPTMQPMESLFSVIATGRHDVQGMGDIMLEDLGGILRSLKQVVTLASGIEEALYRRFLMAYLTGNGDLHLENLSLLGDKTHCRLAPVYDPAPMRAWSRHDLISAIPYDAAQYHNEADMFLLFGQTLGLTADHVADLATTALKDTRDYVDRIKSCSVPDACPRERLIQVALRARENLQSALSDSDKTKK